MDIMSSNVIGRFADSVCAGQCGRRPAATRSAEAKTILNVGMRFFPSAQRKSVPARRKSVHRSILGKQSLESRLSIGRQAAGSGPAEASMGRRSIFLAAGGKQNRDHKNDDDHWHNKERGSNVHGADS
jgi:hypothetical protein